MIGKVVKNIKTIAIVVSHYVLYLEYLCSDTLLYYKL